MNYTVREYLDRVEVIGDGGLLSASLTEWTAGRARHVLGRNLLEGERFYWLNKIQNKSEKKGEGTKLLRFVIDMFEERDTTLGLIASPDLPGGEGADVIATTEERLTNWYKRHGFREVDSRYPALVYEPKKVHDKML